jgi:hypothetical protein
MMTQGISKKSNFCKKNEIGHLEKCEQYENQNVSSN